MDKSFDLDALLKQHSKKHKIKPVQFVSVAGGIQNRLEKTLKYRKSNRLSVFDSLRNLPQCESPAPKNNVHQKLEHRKQQLEKWKLEKEKKKKEDAKNKKKPFVAGVAHSSLRYLPPPPAPIKAMPSTSGRVTRSQSSRPTSAKSTNEPKNTKQKAETSFAPKNASFRAPEIKNLSKFPTLAPVTKKSNIKNIPITFEPLLPKKTQKSNSNRPVAAMSTITETTARPVANVQVETTRVTRSRAANNLKSMSETVLTQKSKAKIAETSKAANKTQNSTAKSIKPTNKAQNSAEKSPVFKVRTSNQHSNKGTPKNPIPKSESSSEERLRSPKNVVDAPMTPEVIANETQKISPCVTLSRGKSNARKEMKKKIEEGLLDEDTSSESVAHFRRQLSSETDRISARCDEWENISAQVLLPEAVQEAVLSAVGQARLLLAQKFQQFASLVSRCETPDVSRPLVTAADLAGFWDMLFIQVENVDMRFNKLEELRARNWQEQNTEVKLVNKPVVRKVNKPAATSRMRDIIAAARKAKKQQQTAPPQQEDKTFEAGFFCVRSPVRSSAESTPQKLTLLKEVLSSEARKASASKNRASMAMLRASMIGKNMDSEGEQFTSSSSLTPINLYATPARSILKSTNKEVQTKSGKKSIKVVLFDDSDNENSIVDLNDTSNKVEYTTLYQPENIDSGMSSMEKENDEYRSVKRRSKLTRQEATDDKSPVLTRSRRKSMQNTPQASEVLTKGRKSEGPEVLTPRRSGRKKVLQELQDNVEEKVTPKRSTRRRSVAALV